MNDKFIIEETPIGGVKIITPERFGDDRGHLTVAYNQKIVSDLLGVSFVQDKWTKSQKGVLRGVHFQEQHPQGKLVSVLSGKVLDIVVDFRKESPTFGQYFSIVLEETNPKMLFMPKGMGHAFLSLEDNSIFFYKTTDYFYPEFDKGIMWNDKDLNIDWQLNENNINQPQISERDKVLPGFKEFYKD